VRALITLCKESGTSLASSVVSEIDVFAMSHFSYLHDPDMVVDRVQNAIVANADPPNIMFSGELFGNRWARFIGQGFDPG